VAIYTHITDSCAEDARNHGQTSLVANLQTSVEQTQNLTGFSSFLPTALLKRSVGRKFRLLAYRVPVQDDEIILFLRLLGRGGKEYEYFLANWDTHAEEVLARFRVPPTAEVLRIHADLTAVRLAQRHPEPDAEEQAWLYEVFSPANQTDELLVLETHSWVKKMRSPENREFLALYHQTLEQTDTATLRASATITDVQVYWDDRTRLGFAYLYRKELDRLLLLEPLRHGDDAQIAVQEYKQVLAKNPDTPEGLARVALRSYPFLIVLEQNAWLAIQKDEEANLALSPEEADLLESINTMGAAGTLGYPLFINGRAGSGKSTMLQYLAADYVDFALRRSTRFRPLYMTCSRDLLERARSTVYGLLTTHHERLLSKPHEPTTINALLQKTFFVFHDFLYSLLQPEQQNKLTRTRYVSYSAFRRLWLNQFAKRSEAGKVPPDVAWHTIRSYIKGIRSGPGDELAPEDFEALPRDRRSVSVETFRYVYDRVWCSWYKRLCDEEGYWDDQDLAAYVLESGAAQSVNCAALICDEAQDFTPIELDLLFQFPLFSRRSLQPEELKRVPIVFAGDPLQTINPTGFRWDAVQADFHDRFCAVLDPRRKSHVSLRYEELQLNYRSNPGIVNFCNLIQLARRAILNTKDILPQKTWWVDRPVQPVWFCADSASTGDQLKRRPELIKLVNCEDGEETEFARADPVLAKSLTEENGVFFNVLGPTRAKGLEWPSATLYRFGESAPANFTKALAGQVELTAPESRLPLEYFFNRLYVAASRAKSQLIILDSTDAIRDFWRFATDMELLEGLMTRAGGKDLWLECIMYLGSGTEETWRGEKIDLEQQGLEYASLGWRNRDPYLMRQAALAFRSGGNDFESGRCLAQASELEGKHVEAGQKYRELDLDDDAFRCYWEGHAWRELCDLTAHKPALSLRLESRAADFMIGTHKPHRSFLDSLLAATRDETWLRRAVGDTSWDEVLRSLGDRLSSSIGDKDIPWVNIQQVLQRLKGFGADIKDDHLAAVAYSAKDFEEAVRLWERTGSSDREEFRRAKARTAPFPERILWLSKLHEHSDIIRQWRDNQATLPPLGKMDESVIKAVIDAALANSDLTLARTLLDVRPDRDRIKTLLSAALNLKQDAELSAAATLAARSLVRLREWAAATRFAETFEFDGLKSSDLRSALNRIKAGPEVVRSVTQELATCADLSAEAVERQEIVAKFLNRNFISKANTWTKEQRSITYEVVGAAIERAGKIVDALQFYETLERDAATEEIRKFAAERLVRNLERHADYLQSRNDEGQLRQRQRGQQLRERLHLGDRKLTEYPVLISASETLAPAPTEWVRGPFKLIVSKTHGRVRIEHTERFETVTVHGKDHRLFGDATVSALPMVGDHEVAWEIADWGAKVTLIDRSTGQAVVFDDGSLFEIALS
jgi:hypothetical protein